jgi:hypothetical protein
MNANTKVCFLDHDQRTRHDFSLMSDLKRKANSKVGSLENIRLEEVKRKFKLKKLMFPMSNPKLDHWIISNINHREEM